MAKRACRYPGIITRNSASSTFSLRCDLRIKSSNLIVIWNDYVIT